MPRSTPLTTIYVVGILGMNGFGGLSFTPFNLFSGLTFDRPGTASLSLSHKPSLGVAVRSANHS